ncbi:hypothetical protein KP509_17G010700 [Ceratopteris richardii]|uniref:Uncharacterized protein n=1 Tax=Ceratopteris richardii TaxID=49495 RepID=A0A8T2SU05_CERRI|nr:hypothetical protein KP509_17G010700 [Ceratopteris richardii]
MKFNNSQERGAYLLALVHVHLTHQLSPSLRSLRNIAVQIKTISLAITIDDTIKVSIADNDAVISAFQSTYHGDATQWTAYALSSCAADDSAKSLVEDVFIKAPPPQHLPQMGLKILSIPLGHVVSSSLSHPLLAPSKTFTFFKWSTSFPPPHTNLVTTTALHAGDVDRFDQPFLFLTAILKCVSHPLVTYIPKMFGDAHTQADLSSYMNQSCV